MCYRRWGHNELDEPAFTQPFMYSNIRPRPSVPKMYEEKLLEEQVYASKEDVEAVRASQRKVLESELQKVDGNYSPPSSLHLAGNWKNMTHITERPRLDQEPATGVDKDQLLDIGRKSVATPIPMKLHPRLQKYHVDARLKKLEQGANIDWATAEALAFGSLLKEGHGVRISGQDVGRGTFSQRHAMFVCQESERTVIPLNHMDSNQAYLEVRFNT